MGVVACTPIRYEYLAPPTPEGRTCAAQCQFSQQQCQQFASIAYQQCLSVYQVSVANYNACRAGGKRSRCITPINCSGGETFSCNRAYDSCFTACGGEIKVIQPPQ